MDKVHFAIERLLEAPEGWRGLVRQMVERWPDATPLALIFAISTAAAEIEHTFGEGSPSRETAAHGWRLAALLAADLYAMGEMGLPREKARDLVRYWAVDPYFRDL